MTNFMRFEENEDGTVSVSMKIDDVEGMVVIPMTFIQLIEMMGMNPTAVEMINDLTEDFIYIPDSPED